MAERDRRGIAAMLAADPEPQLRLRAAPTLDRDPHQVADAALVERLERIAGEDVLVEVVGEELPFGVVAREAERGLRQVVRPEREEVGVPGDLVGPDAGSRQLDHRPAQVVDPALLGDRAHRELAQPLELLGEGDERVHDLDLRRPAGALAHGAGRAHDRAHLHLVDLRPFAARAGSRAFRASDSPRGAPRSAHACARRSPPRSAAGTRAAAGRAAGSSPAARPSPRRSPRSRPAASAAAGRAPSGARPRRRP